MSQKTETQHKWALASYPLRDAFTDFILSHQSILCSPKTIKWYSFILGKVIDWLSENGVRKPQDIKARHTLAYLTDIKQIIYKNLIFYGVQ